MGFAALGQCYATAQAAGAAVCSSYPISFIRASDTAASEWSCTGVSGDGLTLTLYGRNVVGDEVFAVPLLYAYPACNELEQFADVGLVWSVGLGAAVVVWAVKAFVLRLVVPH